MRRIFIILCLLPAVLYAGGMRERPKAYNGTLVADNLQPLRGDDIYTSDPVVKPNDWWMNAKYKNQALFSWYVDSLHLNAVRLSLYRYPMHYESPDNKGYIPNDAYRAQLAYAADSNGHMSGQVTYPKNNTLVLIDTFVNRTKRWGMYLIIDYHPVGGVDTTDFFTFWGDVASEYADEKHVIYEMLNEPILSPSPESFMRDASGSRVRKHPTKSYTSPQQIGWITGFTKRGYAYIRASAPQTPIIISSINPYKIEHGDNSYTMLKWVTQHLMTSSFGPALPLSPTSNLCVIGWHGYYGSSLAKYRDSIRTSIGRFAPTIMTEYTCNTVTGVTPYATMRSNIYTHLFNPSGTYGAGFWVGGHSFFIQTIAKHYGGDVYGNDNLAKTTIGRVLITENTVVGSSLYGKLWPKDPATGLEPSSPNGPETIAWALDDSYSLPWRFVSTQNDSARYSSYRNSVWHDARDSVSLFAARNEVVAFQVILENLSYTDTSRNLTITLDSLSKSSYVIKNTYTDTYYKADPYNYLGKNIRMFVANYSQYLGMNDYGRSESGYSWWGNARPGSPYDTVWTQGDSAFIGLPEHLFPAETKTTNQFDTSYTYGQGGFPFFVPKRSNQSVWVEVYVPKDVDSGTYKGTLRILQGGTQIDTMKVSLRVWDFALSDTNHTLIAGPITSQVNEWHGVTRYPADPAYWTLMKRYLTVARQHRLNAYPSYAVPTEQMRIAYQHRGSFSSLYNGLWFSDDSSNYGANPCSGVGFETMFLGDFTESRSAQKWIAGDSSTGTYGTDAGVIDRSNRTGLSTGRPGWGGKYYHAFNADLGYPPPATLDPDVLSIWTDSTRYKDSLWAWIDCWADWRDSVNSSLFLVRNSTDEPGVLGGAPSFSTGNCSHNTAYGRTSVRVRDTTDLDEIYISSVYSPGHFHRSDGEYTWVYNKTRNKYAQVLMDSSVGGGRWKLRLWRNITGQTVGDTINIGIMDENGHYGGDTSAGPLLRMLERWYGTNPSGKRIARTNILQTPYWKSILYDDTSAQRAKYEQINLTGALMKFDPATFDSSKTNIPWARVNMQWRQHRDSLTAWKNYSAGDNNWSVALYGGARPNCPADLLDAPPIDHRMKSWMVWQTGVRFHWYYVLTSYGTGSTANLWKPNSQPQGDLFIWPGTDIYDPQDSRQLSGPVMGVRMKNASRGVQDLEYVYEAQRRNINIQPYLDAVGPLYSQTPGAKPVPPLSTGRGWAQFPAQVQTVVNLLGRTIEDNSLALPTGTFSVDSDTLDAADDVTLTWTSQNAVTATIDKGVGSVALNGSKIVAVDTTITFTLTLTNPSGSTAYTVRVWVRPGPGASGSISVLPNVLSQGGGKVYVSWQTQDADSEVVLGPNRDTIDTRVTSGLATYYLNRPGWWTFTLLFWDFAGADSVKDSAYVTPHRRVFPGIK